MTETSDPRQLYLFPELSEHPDLPSITTLPEFDHALQNLIKISDLGAFIQLNIQGMDKRYSLHFHELDIPSDFLKPEALDQPLKTFYLFPDDMRRTLKKMAYDVKAFFNSKNSFRTSFGFFLFRSHFTLWKHYLEETRKGMDKTLYNLLGQGRYNHYLYDCLKEGSNYLQQFTTEIAPWNFNLEFTIKIIEERRHALRENQVTLSALKATEITYPMDLLILKTFHFPLRVSDYVSRIQITSIFKTIHLEYLVDKEIHSIDDVKRLVEEM